MKGLIKFGIAFLVAVLIVGIAAIFVTKYVEDTILSVFDTSSDGIEEILNASTEEDKIVGDDKVVTENKLKDLSGESFSMLLVCTDYRPKVFSNYLPDASEIDKSKNEVGYLEEGFRITGASSICLVQCSKEYGGYIFTPIAPNTNVSTPAGYETLYNVFGYYGFEYFMAKVESITGVPVDYYAVVNCTDVKSIVDVIGAVYCDVPCDILTDGKVYVGTSGASKIKAQDPEAEFESFLEECSDYIGPSSMGLLLYSDYSDGIDDELIISDGYTKGVFQNFAKLSGEGQASLWKRIEKYAISNITTDFFTANSELISAYSGDIAVTISYPGLFKPSSDAEFSTFEPNISKGVDAISKYR